MPISREPMLAPRAQHRLAARDVGAGIGDELSGRDGAAQLDRGAAAFSISSVCSIIATASAPRGITPRSRRIGDTDVAIEPDLEALSVPLKRASIAASSAPPR